MLWENETLKKVKKKTNHETSMKNPSKVHPNWSKMVPRSGPKAILEAFVFWEAYFEPGRMFFPQHLCFGSPFLSPLTVSIVIAGTALFRPPRGTRNAVIIVVVVIVFFIVLLCLYFTTGGFSERRLSLHNDLLDTPSRVLTFFPQHLCFGSPFLPPLTVSTVIAGTALFRPPRGTRNPVVVIVIAFLLCLYLVLASFLGGDYHYTTIIFHTTKVNIDIGTKILKAKFAGRFRHFFDTSQKFKPICAVAFFILRRTSTTPAL